MKKEIRVVDQQRGIVQVTTVDERFYARPTTDPKTGLPMYAFVPSTTWICDYYPKGIAFFKWLANAKNWDEVEALKEAAGNKGSKDHHAIGELLTSGRLPMEARMLNPSTEQMEPLSLEEYEALMSFVAWHELFKPVILAHEFVVWNDQEGYAGTVDLLCLIKDEPWLIDFKTSQHVWPSHELQVSAYKHAKCPEQEDLNAALTQAKLGILQIGYKHNKVGWKFTEVVDQFPLFLAVKAIWAKETAGQKPFQRDYPLVLTITPHYVTDESGDNKATQPTQTDGASASQGTQAGGDNESHRGRTTGARVRTGETGRVATGGD